MDKPCEKCEFGKFRTVQCLCQNYRIWSIEQTVKKIRKETEEILSGKKSYFEWTKYE